MQQLHIGRCSTLDNKIIIPIKDSNGGIIAKRFIDKYPLKDTDKLVKINGRWCIVRGRREYENMW